MPPVVLLTGAGASCDIQHVPEPDIVSFHFDATNVEPSNKEGDTLVIGQIALSILEVLRPS